MTSLKIYISSHGEDRNIKFGEEVNLIQNVPLGAPSQKVVTSLPHNHMTLTNLFISSYRGATVILGSKNNSSIEVHRALLHWRSQRHFDHVTLINLYISGYRVATRAMFIVPTLKGCVCYIFASLFCMPKREHFLNTKKCFLFHFKSSFCS